MRYVFLILLLLTGVAALASAPASTGALVTGHVFVGVSAIGSAQASPGALDTISVRIELSGVAAAALATAVPGILVTTVSADYMATLTVTPTRILPIRSTRRASVHQFTDGRIRAYNLSGVFYDAEMQWDYLSAADRETILDWYHDEDKANGIERTFYWEDRRGQIYVMRFMGPLETVFEPASLQSFDRMPVRLQEA